MNLLPKMKLAPTEYWKYFEIERYMYCMLQTPIESTLTNVILPCKVNDSYVESFCGSACGKQANDYLKDKCGVSLADISKSIYNYTPTNIIIQLYLTQCCLDTVCSKDPRDQHYCFTYNKILNTSNQFSEALQGPCATKDCSDPTCNAAVKNVC